MGPYWIAFNVSFPHCMGSDGALNKEGLGWSVCSILRLDALSDINQWCLRGLNTRPHACEASALTPIGPYPDGIRLRSEGGGGGKVGGKSTGNILHLELFLPTWKKKIQPGTFSSRLEEKVPTWKFFLPAGRKIPTWEFFLPPGRKTSHQRNQDGVTILIY